MAKTQKRLDEDFLPTPPIGYRVQWIEQGLKNRKPADVIAHNEYGPGILTLSVNMGNRWQMIEVVHWEDHPGAQVGTPGVKQRGTWAYMPNEQIPESHYDLHVRSIEMQAENVKRQQAYIKEQQRAAEEAANQPVDPIAVEVARIQANAVLNG